MIERPPADLIAGPAIVITQDARRSILRDAYLAVTAGAITYAGPEGGLPPLAPGGKRLDATGQFIVPGLIDTHTHLYQTLMKGLGDDMKLLPWLERLTIPTSGILNSTETYLGAAVGLAEAIRSGTTTVLDFFVATENGDLWTGIARGFAETGVRGLLGFGLAEGLPRMTMTLEAQLDEIRSFAASSLPPLLAPMLGPGVTRVVSHPGFRRIREEADRFNLPITLHLHEIVEDELHCQDVWGTSGLAGLEDAGFLGPDVVLAHCCYFSDADIEICARTGATVSNNPVSNMYLGNKPARVTEMLDAGIVVSLGADGAASNNTQDMLEALKMCALVQKGAWEDAARVTAQTALDIATLNGATAIGRPDLGSLEPGKRADFFLFDPRTLRSGPWHEPVSTIVYSGGEMNVTATVVDGRVLMEKGRLLTVDEGALIAEAQEAAIELRERAGTGHLLDSRPWARAADRLLEVPA